MAAKAPIEDAKPYAAYLLGKMGDRKDIPALIELYYEMEKTMRNDGWAVSTIMQRKQNIIDAIELIRYREERDGKR